MVPLTKGQFCRKFVHDVIIMSVSFQNQESPLSIWTSIHRRCRRCPYYQYYILFTMIFLISIMIKTKHGSIDYRSVPRPARPKPGAKAGLMDPTSYMKKVRAQDVGPIFIPDNLKSEDSKWDYRLDAKASDSVPLNRFVLDYRHPKCRSVVYDEARMPNMTIIIPFYNEVNEIDQYIASTLFCKTLDVLNL